MKSFLLNKEHYLKLYTEMTWHNNLMILFMESYGITLDSVTCQDLLNYFFTKWWLKSKCSNL